MIKEKKNEKIEKNINSNKIIQIEYILNNDKELINNPTKSVVILTINFKNSSNKMHLIFRHFIKTIKKLLKNHIFEKLKNLKIIFKNEKNEESNNNNINSLQHDNNSTHLRLKDKIILCYSITNHEIFKEKLILKENLKIKIEIEKDKIFYFIKDQYSYLFSKKENLENNSNFSNLLISDYLNPGRNLSKSTATATAIGMMNQNSDKNLFFYSTLSKISKNFSKNSSFKNKLDTLRLPEFDLSETNITKLKNEINFLQEKISSFNLSYLAINLTYHIKSTSAILCCDNQESKKISENIIKIIFHLISIFTNTTVIVNITLSNIDECFPVVYLFEKITNFNFDGKFIINFRGFFVFIHPSILPNGSVNIFSKGNNLFVNKSFIKIEDFDVIYSLLSAMKGRNSKLKKIEKMKYIKLLLAKFMVRFKLFEIDRFNDQNLRNLRNSREINLQDTGCSISNVNIIENSKLKKIVQGFDSNDEVKMIHFCENFCPI
jgi:hypothetical protein